MKRHSTLLLRIALILLALPVGFVLVYAFPRVIVSGMDEIAKGPTSSAPLVLVLIGVMYLSAIPFFLSLFQANKLLQYINRKQAFSALSVEALRKIKFYSFSFAALYTLSLPLLYIISDWDNAPGFIIFGFLFIGIAFVSAVFVNLLEALVEEGIGLKS